MKGSTTPEKPLSAYPWVVACRVENEAGEGGWTMVGADDWADGERVMDTVGRYLAAIGPFGPEPRCSIVRNDGAGWGRWARGELRRRRRKAVS